MGITVSDMHHVAVQVADLERSITFYQDTLGPVSYTHLD